VTFTAKDAKGREENRAEEFVAFHFGDSSEEADEKIPVVVDFSFCGL
jgi:hypothetical protein